MVYLVDASVYVFRAWFALPDSMESRDGEPINAFRGFAGFLASLLEELGEAPLAIAFDESLVSSFRNEIHPDYKSSRELPPAELERQFQWCRELCRALGLVEMASPRYEADDLIASLAREAHGRGEAVTVLSRDKDLSQVLRDGDFFWRSPDKPPQAYHDLAQNLGFPPERMADYLALVGDPVDDIPGVPGVGAKTAARLIAHFEDLDGLYGELESRGEAALQGLKLRGAAGISARLREHRDTAYHARRLTGLVDDIPGLDSARPPGRIDRSALEALDAGPGLGQRLRGRWLEAKT